MQSRRFLLIANAISFFYQWHVHFDEIFKLIVITHRDQKIFLVLIMRCMNSIVYAQRKINRILKSIKDIVCVYIDDIVCDFEILKKHIANLHKLFTILSKANVFISFKKTFLKYSDISLLDQKINVFELVTIKNKLKAIANI